MKFVRFVFAASLASAAVQACGQLSVPDFVRPKAGRDWRDGLLVANGSTAALVYAPSHFEWTINRNDLYDGTFGGCEYMHHSEVKKMFESMHPPHTMHMKDRRSGDGSLRSTISAATLRVSPWASVGWAIPSPPAVTEVLRMKSGHYTAKMNSPWYPGAVECCVPRRSDVLAVRIVDERFPKRRYKINLDPIDDHRLGPARRFASKEVSGFSRRIPDGRYYAVARSEGKEREFTVAVRVAGSEAEAERLAREAAVTAAKAGFEALAAENAGWWDDFWRRGAQVSLPQHPELELQWYYSLYSLASQYGTAPMPGLNGLVYGPWNSSEPGIGSQGYTHDQNVQIPMFAFFPLNHAEFVVPFADTYFNALPLLKKQTRERFGVEGVCLPLNMNQDGRELPVGGYRYTLCGSAYSGLVLCWAWRYTRDTVLLREKIYPLLKEFAAFYLALSEKGADGRYHFDRMIPPEIFSVTIDESSAVSMLHTCLVTLVEASETLGVDADLRKRWRDVLAHYPEIERHSSGGWWCGPEIPDDAMMWGGHLFYPFFPSEYDTENLDAARKTLEYARNEGMEMIYGWGKPHPSTDWSMFYQTATAVRLGAEERGWEMVNDFYDWFRKPNGLFSHNPVIVDPAVANVTREDLEAKVRKMPEWNKRSWNGKLVGPSLRTGGAEITADPDAKRLVPPVIEGGSAFLFVLSETLCQSWGGKVRLFPCVPEGFTGEIRNFRVQGGGTVSAKMVNGKIVELDN